MTDAHRYLGKYRGTVFNNLDPEKRGRIQAIVPDVLGLTPTTFALPCLPAAGKGSGSFFLPEIGSAVWMEFEQGDPDYPIWTGCFWGNTAELPEMGITSPTSTPNIVLQTSGRNCITVFGAPGGGITLSAGPINSQTSPRIIISQESITITNGLAEIKLKDNSVSINTDGLVVT